MVVEPVGWCINVTRSKLCQRTRRWYDTLSTFDRMPAALSGFFQQYNRKYFELKEFTHQSHKRCHLLLCPSYASELMTYQVKSSWMPNRPLENEIRLIYKCAF